MFLAVTRNALRATAASVVSVALFACTTFVPLSRDYAGPDVLPAQAPAAVTAVDGPPTVTGDIETRERAHFVVRHMSAAGIAPSAAPPSP